MKFNELSQDVESRLKLKPNKATFSLALAEIVEVKLTEAEVALTDDKGSESKNEYKGIVCPRLAITWKSVKVEGEEDRYHTESWGPIVSIKNDGTPLEKKVISSLYTTMFSNLIHIHNCYKKAPNYKAIAGSTIPEIDETATPEVRAKQTKAFFQVFLTAFNGVDDKAVYEDVEGNPIPVWLKLVAEYKTQKKYTTPSFVGQGYTEMAIRLEGGLWKTPNVELQPNESITLIENDSKKSNNQAISTQQDDTPDELKDILAKYK